MSHPDPTKTFSEDNLVYDISCFSWRMAKAKEEFDEAMRQAKKNIDELKSILEELK